MDLKRLSPTIICTLRPRSASTRSRPTARRPTCTAPPHLAGLWAQQEGRLLHDGRFATLLDVVNHYDSEFDLKLSEAQKKDLIE